MLKYLNYLLRALAKARRKPAGNDRLSFAGGQARVPATDLKTNLVTVRESLGESFDLTIREFKLGQTQAAVLSLAGLVDKNLVNSHILEPLMVYARMAEPNPVHGAGAVWEFVKNNTLSVHKCQEAGSLDQVLDGILSGFTVLLIDGVSRALLVETIGLESRSVSEPQTESVIRGPREGFTERLQVNTALLRRKIKAPDLRLEKMTLGRVTRTDLCIAYIQGIANDKIVEELKRRLQRIDIDGVLESGYIEGFIEDAPFSMFPTVGNTEKPDIVAAKLLEGRVAVMVDGTPIVLTVPQLFVEMIQASEDYYNRWLSGSIARWLRLLAVLLTTVLPALYVATLSYSPEVLPTIFMLTIAAAREGIPFPAIAEMFILGAIFEILREAGIRQPRPVGQAVSIVGVLVIGQASISAGVVSAPGVMTVALTAISSFVVPALNEAYILIRLFLLLLVGLTGMFGLFLGLFIILIHMVSLRSFGAPYLSPVTPRNTGDWKDVFIRVPWWAMRTRPAVIGWKNRTRLGDVSMPHPPKEEKKRDKQMKGSRDNA